MQHGGHGVDELDDIGERTPPSAHSGGLSPQRHDVCPSSQFTTQPIVMLTAKAQAITSQIAIVLTERRPTCSRYTANVTEAKHGTRSGYTSHFTKWKTPTCAPCRAAHTEYMSKVQLAQRDANRRLRVLHPSEWDAIYAEEKQRRGL